MNTINYKASVLTELEKLWECVVFQRRKKNIHIEIIFSSFLLLEIDV